VPHVTPLRAEDPDRVGRYRLSGRISGLPGIGPAYRAVAVDGSQVVVRLLGGTWTRDPAARDRFTAEASAAARVPPFCAARIIDAGVEGDQAYLVSEYVAGRSLLETVTDEGQFRGPELEALAIGTATGLASVHEAGLVHASFGPDHVIMSAAGPRVVEYGITPPYGSATPSADMLAWAQTMMFAAIGRPPSSFADLDAMTDPLRQTVADCLSADPAQRPSARTVILGLLDVDLPHGQVLAAGTRRAALAARMVADEASYLAAAPAEPALRGREAPGRALPGRTGSGRSSGEHSRLEPRRAEPARRTERGPAEASRPDHGRAGRGQAQGERPGGPPRRPFFRRPGVLAAVAVVVVAVVAVALVRLGGSGRHGNDPQSGSSTSPVSATTSTGPGSPPQPSGPVTVPATLAGTWSGSVQQTSPPDDFDVKLMLPSGVSDGSVTYSTPGLTCAGDLSPDNVQGTTLVLDQGIVSGRRACADGTVTLSPGPNGTLRFTFRARSGPVDTGTLSKS
jgi:eukaryotic-like serine/threonine-protein kinase